MGAMHRCKATIKHPYREGGQCSNYARFDGLCGIHYKLKHPASERIAALEAQLTEAREAIRDLLADEADIMDVIEGDIWRPECVREMRAKLARLRKVVE